MKIKKNPLYTTINKYLLLASFARSVRQVWTEFFPSFYGPSAKRAGHENKEGKNEDPYFAVRTEQTRLIRCLLYGFVHYSGFEKVIES